MTEQGPKTLQTLLMTPVGLVNDRPPARATRDTALGEVVQRMVAARRGVTLIEAEGKLLGIFTEFDLHSRVDHTNDEWRQRPVHEFMTTEPFTVRPEQPIAAALGVMHAGGFRHLPIVNAAGEERGVLSVRDILVFLAEGFPEAFLNLPPDPKNESHRRYGG